MLRLSKKVEYALLALQYMANSTDEIMTAKGLSDQLGISFEFLSKALQSLMKNGVVQSHQGIKGGYALAKKPEDISVSEIMKALDDSMAVVECFVDGSEEICGREKDCSIRYSMGKMQRKINDLFNSTSLAELAYTNPKNSKKISQAD